MAPAARIIVKGQKELDASFRAYERKVKYRLAKDLLVAAKLVSDDARNRFSTYDPRSAAGFRPRVRARAIVVVEQRRRKTTGQHPQFGALQMRKALIPALNDKQEEVVATVDRVLSASARDTGF